MERPMLRAGLLFLVLLIASAGCRPASTGSAAPPDDTLARIARDRVLRVAYIDYPPSAFRDPSSGEIRGHFVDTLREIMRQLDPEVRLEFEETTWADFTAALNTGRVDLSIAGTFATIPRAKAVAFTRPLTYLGRSAIVRRGDTRFTAAGGPLQFDRPDITVGVVEGEGSHEFVRATFKNLDKVRIFSGSDLSQSLAAVSAGQVDVGLSDALETAKYAARHADTIDLFAAQPYDLTPVAWAVRHDDVVWKDFLNTAIDTLETQGKLVVFERAYDYRWVQPVRQFQPR